MPAFRLHPSLQRQSQPSNASLQGRAESPRQQRSCHTAQEQQCSRGEMGTQTMLPWHLHTSSPQIKGPKELVSYTRRVTA